MSGRVSSRKKTKGKMNVRVDSFISNNMLILASDNSIIHLSEENWRILFSLHQRVLVALPKAKRITFALSFNEFYKVIFNEDRARQVTFICYF